MPLVRLSTHKLYNDEECNLLTCCTLCPRECGVNRFRGGNGYCGMDAGMNIAAICIHKGEEPPISGHEGICNIFFSGCNLRCIYCQNHEISRRRSEYAVNSISYAETIDTVVRILDRGIRAIGFVSASHMVPQIKAIIRGLNKLGYNPVTIYNTNCFDKLETLKDIANLIDVYLPDYKYITPELAYDYSDAYNYPEVALKALKEMYYQKGSRLITDDEGVAEKGLLIRHLVLPGHTDESKKILRNVAEELSTGVNVSLMSQYHPAYRAKDHNFLSRPLYEEEYDEVAAEMEKIGFRNGWLQDMESFDNYMPDFTKKNPFE